MPEDIFDTDEIQVQADIPDNVTVNEYGSTVEIGTVTTLDYGENATVTNTGTADHAILNFGIPRGSSGAGWGILEGDIENQTDLWTILTGLRTDVDIKAPLASAVLTGTPTAPTAVDNTNTDQIATTKFVQNAINLLNASLRNYIQSSINTAVANVLKQMNFWNAVDITLKSNNTSYTVPSNGYLIYTTVSSSYTHFPTINNHRIGKISTGSSGDVLSCGSVFNVSAGDILSCTSVYSGDNISFLFVPFKS